MTLAQNQVLRIVTLCALYFAQGVPWGFVTITFAAWLAKQGLRTEEVAYVGTISTLPWTFKFLWGPVIDRWGLPSMGRRRPWILFAQAMMGLTLLAIVAVPDVTRAVTVVAWMIFAHNVFNALQDVAVDALGVDLLPASERGRANGLMYGSKYLGGVVGGAGLATVLEHGGLRVALITQAALMAGIFLLPLLLRERPGEQLLPWRTGGETATAPAAPAQPADGAVGSLGQVFRDLLRAFSLRSTLLGAALALLSSLGVTALSVIGTVLVVQKLGWSDADWSRLSGGWGLAAGLAGAVGGGYIADALGHKRTIALAASLLALTWLGFAFGQPHWGDRSFIWAVSLAESFLGGVFNVAVFALVMGLCWPRVAATQFTSYMALMNLSTVIGYRLAGPLDAALDYPEIWIVCACLAVLPAAVLPFIDPGQTRRVLGEA
ncbi:MAG: MFS transporter [Deltaproteobacteria bacterium]|nr:MFS transporter [Deltaproteobacteria bacterium]